MSLSFRYECYGDSDEKAQKIFEAEEKADHYEDILGTYLVKLSRCKLSDADSSIVSKFLKLVGDYERISDHSENVVELAEEKFAFFKKKYSI